jgi:hypothetical protein
MPRVPLLGEEPTPLPTSPPTSAPVQATPAPSATTVVTEEVAFPAYWAAGMYQDAEGKWWPAEEVREEVVATVKEHYLEGEALLSDRPETEVLETVSDEMARRYLTGQYLEDWLTYRKRYEETGAFNETTQIVTERTVNIHEFGEEGQTAIVADTVTAAHLLVYDAQTNEWERIDIPQDGILNGTQYLGVVISEVTYDEEDGRWKSSLFIKWIPRPEP